MTAETTLREAGRETLEAMLDLALAYRERADELNREAIGLAAEFAPDDLVAAVTAAADLLSPTSDGSGSLPPDDPGPSPTPPAVGFIVTLGDDVHFATNTQLWVRRDAWGALAVDSRPSPSATWFPLADATVEIAP